MKNKEQIKNILKEALNLIYKLKCLEVDGMSIAQKLGLQGEKRRLRYESLCNHNLMNYLICDSFDTYAIDVKPDYANTTPLNIQTTKDFFEIYLQKMEEQYDVMHTIANNLVQNNCQYYAKCFYAKCHRLIDDIKYYKRTIMEGNMANWDPMFIMMSQTTQENIHDHFEKLEEDGVKYKY